MPMPMTCQKADQVAVDQGSMKFQRVPMRKVMKRRSDQEKMPPAIHLSPRVKFSSMPMRRFQPSLARMPAGGDDGGGIGLGVGAAMEHAVHVEILAAGEERDGDVDGDGAEAGGEADLGAVEREIVGIERLGEDAAEGEERTG